MGTGTKLCPGPTHRHGLHSIRAVIDTMNPSSQHMARRSWLVLGVALAVANLAMAWMDELDGQVVDAPQVDEDQAGSAVDTLAAPEEPAPGQRAAFLAAWERWDTGEHAVSGVLTRVSENRQNAIKYRESRRDGRWLRQIGPSAVLGTIEHKQVCHQDADGIFLCTTMEADTSANEVDNMAFAGDTGADYVVRDLDHPTTIETVVGAEPARPGRCWEAELNGDDGSGRASVDADHPWGKRSWFCFDDETGALMLRHTITDGGTETAVAHIVSGDVTEQDLAPSPTLADAQPETRG